MLLILGEVQTPDDRVTDRAELLGDDRVPLLPAGRQPGPRRSLGVPDLIGARHRRSPIASCAPYCPSARRRRAPRGAPRPGPAGVRRGVTGLPRRRRHRGDTVRSVDARAGRRVGAGSADPRPRLRCRCPRRPPARRRRLRGHRHRHLPRPDRARSRLVPGATFVCADLVDVDLGVERYDAIVSLYALIHVPLVDQQALLPHLRCTPAGRCLPGDRRTRDLDRRRDYLGAPMFWDHADTSTYLEWLGPTASTCAGTGTSRTATRATRCCSPSAPPPGDRARVGALLA